MISPKNSHFAPITKMLCLLAGFPYEYFVILRNPRSKITVLGLGTAVIISPTVFAFSLYTNGKTVFGEGFSEQIVLLIALPLITLLLDLFIVHQVWSRERIQSGWITTTRFALIAISLLIAFATAADHESETLSKSADQFAFSRAMENQSIKTQYEQLSVQIELKQQTINANQERIANLNALKEKYANDKRIAKKEAELQQGGIDQDTGIRIVGGAICGNKCKEKQIDAEINETRITAIEKLPLESSKLQEEIELAKETQQKLIGFNENKNKSLGNLLTGFLHADFGIKSLVIARVILQLILELGAFVLAHLPVANELKEAVDAVAAEEKLSISLTKKQNTALLMAEMSAQKQEIASRLPAVSVTVADTHKKHAISKVTSISPIKTATV